MIVKINILYLEYHPGDARIAESILAKAGVHCNVLAVSDISEYQQAVINVPPDIVISDDGAPLWNAMDALTILKQTGLNIPFIVITDPSTGNIYSVIKVMKQGADDYLLKYHINTLPDVIKAAIGKRDGKNKDFDVRLNTMEAASISEDMLHSEAMQMSGPCEEIYGYRTEELPADPDLQEKINHPDDRQLLQKFTLKLRKGEPITGKYRIRKDNDIRRIENKIKLTPGGKGESALIDSDSHEAKIERDKLILSEQRYRQIVETAQEGIWIIDENLLTIFVNKKLCDMLGYAAEDKPFSAHLTIGRVREQATLDEMKQLQSALAGLHIGELGVFTARAVTLFKSELQPNGPLYTPLFSAQMGIKPEKEII